MVNTIRYSSSYKHSKEFHGGFHPIDNALLIPYNKSRLLGPQKYLCNAPFVNMYFGVDGNVTACCYNRSFPFGNIKENTIQEMWNGKNAGILREYIEHYDLSRGCLGCDQNIRSGSYNIVEAQSYDTVLPKKNLNYPKRMVFELSSTCNLACKMCNGFLSSTFRKYYENEAPYPDKYDEGFITQLIPFLPHLKVANFLGGEPFLIDLYYKIWDKLNIINKSCKIHIQTNGHILNNRVKSVLNKGNINIGISIDSLKKESFENIRTLGNFNTWMKNFDFFLNYSKKNKTDLSLVVTPMIDNMYEIPDLYIFSNDQNVYFYLNTLTEPEEMSIFSLDLNSLSKYFKHLSNQQFKSENTYIQKENRKVYDSYFNQIKYTLNKKLKESQIKKENEENEKKILNDRQRKIIDLNHLSFSEINSLVKDKIIALHQSSEFHEKVHIDVFLKEYENKVIEQYHTNPEKTISDLKGIYILEDNEFGNALRPYVENSIQLYGL